MIRRCLTILAICGAYSLAAMTAGIDGEWTSESKAKGKKGGGTERTITSTFDLKQEGVKLVGSASMSAGKRSRTAEIQDGKIEGNRFSFTTVQKGRKGENNERKRFWEGTLAGDELKGTFAARRGGRGTTFTAKRR